MSDGLEIMLLWFKLRYRPNFSPEENLLKDDEFKFICHVSSTAKMEALQQLQFIPAVNDGTCC
jgi:hypothetical protein